MKILLVSNIVSHHQVPLAIQLSRIVGENNFLFAAMGRPDKERLNNGWSNKYDYSWIVHSNESKHEWMDEGFCTFAQYKTMDYLFKRNAMNPLARQYAVGQAVENAQKGSGRSTGGRAGQRGSARRRR